MTNAYIKIQSFTIPIITSYSSFINSNTNFYLINLLIFPILFKDYYNSDIPYIIKHIHMINRYTC